MGQALQKGNSTPYGGSDSDHEPEAVNKKAVTIVNRVRDKLTGNRDVEWMTGHRHKPSLSP